MKQKSSAIALRFGISIAIRSEAEPEILKHMESLLQEQLKAAGTRLPPKAKVYVKQLQISAKPVHFGVSEVTERLVSLTVAASLMDSKDSSKLGVSIYDLGVQSHPDIQVLRKPSFIKYTLPSSYIAQHDQYTDHVAIVVNRENEYPLPRFSVKLSAKATPDFARKLRNVPGGIVVSTLTFRLAQEIQLTLAM